MRTIGNIFWLGTKEIRSSCAIGFWSRW